MFSNPEKNVLELSLPLGASVADFGSGSGYYARALSLAVGAKGKVYAIDIQKDLLSRLSNSLKREGLENVEAIWGDLETIGGAKVKDSSLEAVIISNLLFQVADRETVAKEAMRVLKQGGQLLVTDWADSYGGAGPTNESVFKKEKANELFRSLGFMHSKDFHAGAHHYGIIFRKP